MRLWMVLPWDLPHAAAQADDSKGPETAQAAGRGLSVCSFHINLWAHPRSHASPAGS